MKGLYEKNKKLFAVIVACVCVAVCILVAVIISLAGSKNTESGTRAKAETIQTTTDLSEAEENEITGEAVDEVSMEAVTAGALEVVEDSPLDVVEPTQPAVSPSPVPSGQPEATPAPGVVVSNMAQNVEFPYEIHVNKQMNCITVYAMDTSGSYSIPIKAMVCSTGAATPLGVYKTPAKYIWKVLKGNVWGQYSTRISGSILFHSVPYRTNSKNALISKYYNKLGTTASAGCVRLTTADAKWIYDNCPLGTTVVIYNDSNPGPLGKPSAMKVPADNQWDPTDPDPANPWRNKILRLDGVSNRTVERGSSIDLMSGVTATDSAGNNVTGYVQVSTNADTNQAGVYGVHYSITDQNGMIVSADATLTVTDTQYPVFSGVPGRIEGRKASEITRNLLMSGVTVTDNGLPFDSNAVQVQIPTLQDGDNTVTLMAQDAVGNRTTVSVIVNCDMKAPVVSKNTSAAGILELSQRLSQNDILGRIRVEDRSGYQVNYNLTNEEWGYRIDYTVTDSCGNTSVFTDRVSYLTYNFTGENMITVNDIRDTEALKAGLKLKDSKGRSISLPADVQVVTQQINSLYYKADYAYTYSSPLGKRTVTFERIVTVGE